MIRMAVTGIHLDPSGDRAVLILGSDDERWLPILIGLAEAASIARAVEGVGTPRPLTHDLLSDVLVHLKAKLVRIEISDLREGTYYSHLVLEDGRGGELRVDSRPSDAVAVAVRVDAPIYVDEQVLRESRSDAQEIPAASEKEQWKRILDGMTPEDFGKYKM